MATTSFDLAGLFEQTFGYKTTAFAPEFTPTLGDKNSYRTEVGATGSPYYAMDGLHTEYFMPVTLSYNEQGISGTNQVEWQLPYPVITISSKKTIIETALTERRGTVKEFINVQDYEIVIKGFIIQASNEFPESKITSLRNLYEQNVPLSIKCPLTDIFLLRPDRSGSDQVVIQELKFPAIAGVKNVRPYELHLVSDEPFNLISIS